MDFDIARHNMVEQQIRPCEVLDSRVLDLVARAPREDYVPAIYRQLAFADMNIPLPHGQVMMHPKLEARLLQELEINLSDKILEIGTGSGYLTSLLAAFGRHVHSVEIFPEFTIEAARKLAHHGVRNITLDVGDAAQGWDRYASYDVILVTGSLPVLPEALRQSLAPGGRMIAIVGRSPVMDVKRIRRLDAQAFREDSLFETDLPALVNATEPTAFKF